MSEQDDRYFETELTLGSIVGFFLVGEALRVFLPQLPLATLVFYEILFFYFLIRMYFHSVKQRLIRDRKTTKALRKERARLLAKQGESEGETT